jgi:hypothetical protein
MFLQHAAMLAGQNTYRASRFVACGTPFILKRHASFLHFGSGAFCVGGWAVGGFPSLSGLCAARSTDEGVINGLAEYGVESVGGRT